MALLLAAHATSHGGGSGWAVPFLICAAILVGYCVSVLRWPWHNCPRCGGARVNKGSNGKRWGMCKHCSGSGRTQRPGAKAIHAFYWSVLGNTLHKRRKDRHAEAQKRSGYPQL